jgi:ATP-dependent Clp protease protease subunit
MSDKNEDEAQIVRDIIQSIEDQNISWTPETLVHYGPSRRTISFWSDVTPQSVLPLISQIIELEHREKAPIKIHMNTSGGSLHDALALYDIMTTVESEIILTATGMCASAGLILLAGANKRFCTSNTTFFYHQPVLANGLEILSTEQMIETSSAYQLNQRTYDNIIKIRFNISEDIWAANFEGKISKYFTAQEALEFGMVDAIF